ncbi:MAG TPA: hypothetical protein VHW64_15125 [Nocardioides sp.]|jgi:hypothetical protein|uniref:hypothetical protein n=1 Tax=Nocardioides sp. TaxID=35761 RepID=UPI002E34D419|nr:hypothetical protein [Nocardioides sp.]HEX3932034.1 hypothetical protein [Nocardioides sp.]
MFTTIRRIGPAAALVAVGAAVFTFAGHAGADAADGTSIYQGSGADQPAYVFLDARDSAAAGVDPEWSDGQYDAGSVCDANPQLKTLTHGNGDDAQVWYCGELLNACPTPAAGRLLGIAVAPGTDPAQVLRASTCWTYPAGQSIERTAPEVYLPAVTAQDPVFEVAKDSSAADPEWDLEISAPGGPTSGTQIRASHQTVDGSLALHSLGVTAGDGAAETASTSFAYQDWDGAKAWAEVGPGNEWIVVSLADGLRMDPQICLDSGICQQARTLHYVGSDGSRDSATILSHM